ncbi:ABC transporter permease [Lichenihabitans psoromatis]|uniref:ABC transporter permease n=1 Tax=Lichenihabitans psoromatis TaxID=2528642 RepID=UPI00103843A8|nr:ABC transporter permease [Lichenihabitans psoromatis]
MRLLRPLLNWDGLLAVLTLLTLLYATLAVPNFATSFNISQAIAGVSEKALLVLPMALLMITREIDLSVASMLALSSVVLGALIQADVPLAIALPIVLVVGAVAGLINGLLVTRLALSSLVVTLGTMALFRGIGYVILGSASVNVLPDVLTDFGINTVLGNVLPWTIVPFLVLAPIFVVVLHRTPIGRRIYAVGGNPETARYSGIDGKTLRLMLFVVSGLVSAVAGIVFTARLSNARADNAVGFELDVITVALLGGINVFGGRGNLAGVFWALALVAVLRNVLGLSQIGGDAQGIVIGSLLIVSLLASNVVQSLVAAAQWRKTVKAQQRDTAPASRR